MIGQPYEYLPVAVRAWPDMRKSGKGRSYSSFPHKLLVIDTETTADPSQSLLFGSAKVAWVAFGHGDRFRVFHEPDIKDEVIFYADNLPKSDPAGFEILCRYCEERNLNLISQAEFARKYMLAMGFPAVTRKTNPWSGESVNGTGWNDATMTFFNAPFDISRLAYGYGNSIGSNAGGFTFHMMPPGDESSRTLVVKHIDSKKHLTKPSVLDLRTLVWAMTNKSHSLASACRAFQLPEEFCKGRVEEHGRITPEYIDYNRQDVTATTYLACEVLRQYHEHPIPMSPVNALSPASIGKSYLDAMGVSPILDRENVPRDPVLLGHAASAFYGGRAECNIRNTPVPVMLLDFQSMYSTVNALMGLWEYITADSITAVDNTAEVRAFLESADLDTVLNRETWPYMTGIAEIRPDGDILPVRAAYGADQKNVTNVGDNYLYSGQPFWYAIPDLINSKLRTGKTPKVLRAVRFIPDGKLAGLQSVDLMGKVRVNPDKEDFFQRVIEQRASIKSSRQGKHGDYCLCQSCRVIEQLKVISNSTSYGIYVEMLRRDTGVKVSQNVYGMNDTPWEYRGTAVETAQKYCYPPIGALITSGARLMLGILEALISEYGGTGAFRDTDSTAVVASADGGLIPCPGGAYELDGKPAIKVLSRLEVEQIRERINRLNPYQGAAGKAILKNEATCWAYVISAKRYCLFTYDEAGRPVVPSEIDGKRAFMEHGLGLYLNPDNIESASQDWMRQLWQVIVSQAHGIEVQLPSWIDRPALTRSAVTSPHLMQWFDIFNEDKTYSESVKPFGFMLLCSEYNPLGFLNGSERRMVAPYSSDPSDWTSTEWRNLHDPTAPGMTLGTDFQVKTFRHVLREYGMNPEVKSLAPDGLPCGPRTVGLLTRRTVRAKMIRHIGKESNKLEQVTDGLLDDWDDVVTNYGGPVVIDPARVLFSQPGVTSTWIAEQINAHTEMIRHKVADGKPYTQDDTRKAIMVTATVIRDWLNGRKITPELARLINEMAARIIRPVVGIPDEQIAWQAINGSARRYAPETLLALWREMGYPSPATGAPLSTPDIKPQPVRETRICARERCANPITRSNALYCGRKCARLAQEQRARARAKVKVA